MTHKKKYFLSLAFGSLLFNSAVFAEPDDLIDASAIGDYPAEIASLNHAKFFAGVNQLNSRDRYRGNSALDLAPIPLIMPVSGSPADSNTTNMLPSLFLALPLPIPSQNLTLGLGVWSPTEFTGDIQYPVDSILRYNYTWSYFSAKIYTSVLAYQLNDMLSIGAGIDRTRIKVRYNAAVPSDLSGSPEFDNTSNNEARGWGTSWHASILAKLKKTYTMIELAYRSKANITTTGSSHFNYQKTAINLLSNQRFSVPTAAPDQFKLKIIQPLSEKIITSASYIYTRWSLIKVLPFENIAFPVPSRSITENFNFYWKNTSMVILGSRFNLNERSYFTAIGAWSQSQYPMSEDFYIAGFDLGYQATKQIQMVFNFYHQFAYQYDPLPVGSSILTGNTKASKDIVGLKFAYLFDDDRKTA